MRSTPREWFKALFWTPSGALVKDASVELKSLETGGGRTFPTTANGLYSFTAVPPGRYRLRVTATGFASASADIAISTSQTTTQNFTLQIGQASTTVDVQADTAPLLDASDPLRGVTYNETEVGTLPNLNRNINSLVILASGATPTFNPRGGEFTTVNGAQAGQINANGGRSKSTSTQLDYTDANDWEFGGIALATEPTPDMLGEFQVLTNNWAAEYGVKSSAEIVMVTRSGSNSLHGTAYDFLQNAALNARDYFDTTGRPDPLVQNYYGFTLGGPILRNRTFFFAGYEGRSTHGAGTTLVAEHAHRSRSQRRSVAHGSKPAAVAPSANGRNQQPAHRHFLYRRAQSLNRKPVPAARRSFLLRQEQPDTALLQQLRHQR